MDHLRQRLRDALSPEKVAATKPKPVRQLRDMTAVEIAELEKKYGCQVKRDE